MGKTANSEASWALLSEGVSSARIETHRLRHLAQRWLEMVDASGNREHYYAVAGDILTGVPARLDTLDRVLDRTCYALARMGETALRDHLPLEDRYLVDHALEGRGQAWSSTMAERVAKQWVRNADLSPALGFPGGRCHVVERIEQTVRNPKLRDQLVYEVEQGLTIDNREANVIYDMAADKGAGVFTRLIMTPHSQYRMDQRGITVQDVRSALMEWSARWTQGKQFIGQPVKKRKIVQLKLDAERWKRTIQIGSPIEFESKFRLFIVFVHEGKTARLVTAYWPGLSDPKPVGEGSCQVR